jgi:hypothetical protein
MVQAFGEEPHNVPVAGRLRLLWTPLLDYLQVYVETEDGRPIGVVPTTVQLLGPASDPQDPGEIELGSALSQGLVKAISPRSGGDWEPLCRAYESILELLDAAGWTVIDLVYQSSWEHGDSAIETFQRLEHELDIELFEWGDILIYDSDVPGEDGEPSEPVEIIENATLDAITTVFRRHKWIEIADDSQGAK